MVVKREEKWGLGKRDRVEKKREKREEGKEEK